GFSDEEEARILAQRAREAKRNKRLSRREVEGGGLNINSMMDMMTIILVFLIDSYGSNPIQVKGGADLVIPYSTTELSPQDTMQITITRKSIVVGDKTVVAVKDGKVDKSQKKGENSFYIQPLFDRLTEEVSRHRQMAALRKKEFDGVVTVVADRTVPYRLVAEVMYTAGQAQLSKFKFAVVKFGRDAEIQKATQKGGG
ncbi:MAG: biopolymer transporter ExbD, partial [Myxococcota bacterium]